MHSSAAPHRETDTTHHAAVTELQVLGQVPANGVAARLVQPLGELIVRLASCASGSDVAPTGPLANTP